VRSMLLSFIWAIKFLNLYSIIFKLLVWI
jgi:hypothetical protein